MAISQLGDHLPHLQTPVTQVDIAQHMVAGKVGQPLDTFANDRGAQVADVHGLGHIGPAVIDDELAWRGRGRVTTARVGH